MRNGRRAGRTWGAWVLVAAAGCASGSPSPDRPASPQPDGCAALLAGGAGSPVATVSTAPSVRWVAFGDFGTGSAEQLAVAAALREYARSHPPDFGLTLGDNFYEEGLAAAGDPRWKSQWEDLYSPLGVRFYATFGNHDLKDQQSHDVELSYSSQSRSWCFPRDYYTFVAGPVQFFALNTNPIADGLPETEQLAWLDAALSASAARWKVVYGHHPIYSNGHHGDSAATRAALLPLLVRHQVDLYLTGHDHDLQDLVPEGGVHFLIAGGGGKPPRPLESSRCRTWAQSSNGFVALEADATSLSVRFIGSHGDVLHEARWRRGEAVAACERGSAAERPE